jgi:DNA-binding transcriptional LysR family regulator
MADELTERNRLHGVEQLIGALLDGLRTRGHRSPPVSLLQAFYAVCEEEGLSVEEYAKRVELPQSTMSRHLLDLGEPGLRLVTSRLVLDARRHVYVLTERGRLLFNKIEEAMALIERGDGQMPLAATSLLPMLKQS